MRYRLRCLETLVLKCPSSSKMLCNPINQNDITVLVCSLNGNDMGPDGARAIASTLFVIILIHTCIISFIVAGLRTNESVTALMLDENSFTDQVYPFILITTLKS